jgi:hypothetical protein
MYSPYTVILNPPSRTLTALHSIIPSVYLALPTIVLTSELLYRHCNNKHYTYSNIQRSIVFSD